MHLCSTFFSLSSPQRGYVATMRPLTFADKNGRRRQRIRPSLGSLGILEPADLEKVIFWGGRGFWLLGATEDEQPRCVCDRTAMKEVIMAWRPCNFVNFVTGHRYARQKHTTNTIKLHAKFIPFTLLTFSIRTLKNLPGISYASCHTAVPTV